ncbi:hypothetical protein TERTU_2916 [Teredinibacter turnerae T7901]|uniref:Uncharacterized protein n=1 Tax=Teredinibacter turnerae (strain ATCC 39867 / T7901) TaxID=377629 RepID=C5BNC8_TERTT|nr:hypothetical protein TERTU_2916 [Teredinibacter turnerae T7901]
MRREGIPSGRLGNNRFVFVPGLSLDYFPQNNNDAIGF